MSIFLLIVYTSTAFGVAVNYHYCDNYLFKISILIFRGNNGCIHNQKDLPMSCCKDKPHYQIPFNHNIIPSLSVTGLFSLFQNQYPLQNNLFEFKDGNNYDIITFHNRRSYPQPIYLLYNVLRI
jgi:hypothetical protein